MKFFAFAATLAASAFAVNVSEVDWQKENIVHELSALATQFLDRFDKNGDRELTREESKEVRDYIKDSFDYDIWSHEVLQKEEIEKALTALLKEQGMTEEYNKADRFFTLADRDRYALGLAEGEAAVRADIAEAHTLTREEAYDFGEFLLYIATIGDADHDGIVTQSEVVSAIESKPEWANQAAELSAAMAEFGDDTTDGVLSIADVIKILRRLLQTNKSECSVINTNDGEVSRLELYFNVLEKDFSYLNGDHKKDHLAKQ